MYCTSYATLRLIQLSPLLQALIDGVMGHSGTCNSCIGQAPTHPGGRSNGGGGLWRGDGGGDNGGGGGDNGGGGCDNGGGGGVNGGGGRDSRTNALHHENARHMSTSANGSHIMRRVPRLHPMTRSLSCLILHPSHLSKTCIIRCSLYSSTKSLGIVTSWAISQVQLLLNH